MTPDEFKDRVKIKTISLLFLNGVSMGRANPGFIGPLSFSIP